MLPCVVLRAAQRSDPHENVSGKRRKKLKELVAEAIASGRLRSGLAASIYGKSRFMMAPIYGAMGKACLQPVIAREYEKGGAELTSSLRESLEFIMFVCDALPPIELPTLPPTSEKVVVFTDAEGRKRKGNRPPSGHLGFVVYHPKFGKAHAYATVPQRLVDMMDDIKKRQTYIGQFELVAAITPFISLPREWFANYQVELWIDNSGVIGALINGYSGIPDVARIVNTFEFAFAALGAASLYVDYVPSESNPADVPSRAHELGDGAEAAMAEFGQKVEMVIPAFASEDGEWLSFVEIAKSVWY